MSLLLYMNDASPPSRAVVMTVKALGVPIIRKHMDFAKKDHLRPDFVQINPQHVIPTLLDKGLVIWDSHAIIAYLVGKYGNDDSLNPKDPNIRAIVDQRLHFDSGVLFIAWRQIVRPIFYGVTKTITQEQTDAVLEGYDFLEKFLDNKKWIACDQPTIADISLITTATSLDVLIPICPTKFPNLTKWIENAKELPYYSENIVGLNNFKEMMTQLMR